MKQILMLMLITIFLNSCFYVNIKSPLDKDVRQTELGDKVGTSKSHAVLWLVAWGDAGTKKAAENGNIKVISHLDAKYYSILFGLYSSRQTIAYGK